MISTSFTFDGLNSQDFGLSIIKLDSGFFPDPYISGQKINEEKIPKRHIPYFYGVEKTPIEFEITCSLLEGEFTPEKRMQLASWLCKEVYCDFITDDDPNKIYKVISINPSDIMSAGMLQGYFKIQFRADAPWAWSHSQTKNFDLHLNETTSIITIRNDTNALVYYFPEIEFTLAGSTGLTLKNLSNSNEIFQFTNLNSTETIYVNNERKQIISDMNLYRLGNFNKKWFRLVYGMNTIEVTGKCLLTFRYQFPLLT